MKTVERGEKLRWKGGEKETAALSRKANEKTKVVQRGGIVSSIQLENKYSR